MNRSAGGGTDVERELAEAREQQAAIAQILRVMADAPSDVVVVLNAIAKEAAQLCRAPFARMTVVEGSILRPIAGYAADDQPAAAAASVPFARTSIQGRAILERRTLHFDDIAPIVETEFPAAVENARTMGFRAVLAVPLLRGDEALGAIFLYRNEPGLFSPGQVALVETFARQAAIALHSVQQLRATQDALEQQKATGDILRVIATSPASAQPVFDAIASAALRLCRAASALVTLLDGNFLHLVASANLTEEGAQAMREAFPMPLGRQATSARAIQEGRIIVIPDIVTDPEYTIQNLSLRAAFRSTLAVPLMRDGRPIGTITVGKAEPGPFSDSQVALLETFAEQAVIAIENVRLFNELEARTDELARSVNELRALGEVGQAVSSTLDLGTVLSTIVARARTLMGVEGASVYEYDESREAFILRSSDGLPPELVDALNKTPMRPGEGALGRIALTRQPVEIGDIADERAYQSRVRELLVGLGLRSMLAVPLLRESHLLGGLVINRRTPGGFEPQVVDLLRTFATQSALAIQNARLYREIEIKSRELETASRHKSEFLANMSHELRTPLNAIIGFSEVLSEKLFGELNDKQAEYVVDIAESGRHLLSLINDILDLSKIEAGRMELDASEIDLPRTIDQTIVLVRERAERRGIALSSAIGDGVGAIHADARKVKQVLLNLLSNALKFTPAGGRIDVRATAFDDRVEVSVADTGVGIAPEDQDAMFEEFRQVGASAAKAEGTGLGLAISRKFIELHGGRIFVQSAPGAGSTFTFTLPIRR